MAVSVQSRSPFDNARGSAALSEINITPLIDVMLVLLIIFMVIAPVATRSLDSRLPQANQTDMEPQKIELLARGNDVFSLDGVVMDSAMLAQSLAARAASGEPQVLMVGASDDADYQAFADALRLASASGIGEIAHAQ